MTQPWPPMRQTAISESRKAHRATEATTGYQRAQDTGNSEGYAWRIFADRNGPEDAQLERAMER
jgi:hypothetical protein